MLSESSEANLGKLQYTQEAIHNLYYEAKIADVAYQEALVAEYGKDAADMRYSYVLPTRLRLLALSKQAADKRYLDACRIMRE